MAAAAVENSTLDMVDLDLGRVLINGLLDEAVAATIGNKNNNNNNMTLLGNDLDNIETPVDDVEVTEFADPLSILNGPFQAVLLALLVLLSIGANACVINNIRANCIKMRSTHFILIQHLCVADLIGASLILPAPLVTSLQGRWEGGSKLCHLSSVVNVSLWLQHVFMFLMLKVDRVLAATLPIGRYPILTARSGQWLVLLAWLLALAIGAGVTSAAGARFEPSLLLCAPGLPHEFGITLVSLYCSAFASMVVGYVVLIIAVGRKKSKAKGSRKKIQESSQGEGDDEGERRVEGRSNQQQGDDEEEDEEEEEEDEDEEEGEEEQETAIDAVVVVGSGRHNHKLVNGTPSTSSCGGGSGVDGGTGSGETGPAPNNTTTVLVLSNGDEKDTVTGNKAAEKSSGGSTRRRARRRRRRRRRREHSSANLKSAATSLIVTASHLLLYLPALLLLGLQGTVVNPVAAALCALIVYSEFLIHPMVLLSTSRRMRHEVFRTLKRHSSCCTGCCTCC